MLSSSPSLRLFCLVLVFWICLPGPQARSQEVADKRLCPKCNSTGKIPNPEMTEALLAMEGKVKICSHIHELDKKGRGLSWVPCERCRNPSLEKAAQEEFEAIVAEREEWIQARRERVDQCLNPRRELLHMQTEHFIIAWNIPKITTAEKKTYKIHEALHLYAERMEAFYADFLRILEMFDHLAGQYRVHRTVQKRQ